MSILVQNLSETAYSTAIVHKLELELKNQNQEDKEDVDQKMTKVITQMISITKLVLHESNYKKRKLSKCSMKKKALLIDEIQKQFNLALKELTKQYQ